jgi:hypothetical protein
MFFSTPVLMLPDRRCATEALNSYWGIPPDERFRGIEISSERTAAGNRINIATAFNICQYETNRPS